MPLSSRLRLSAHRRLCGLLGLVAVLVAAGPLWAADPDPLRLTHVLDVDGRRIPVPMEVYLTPRGETRVAVKVAGNLGALQRAMPALLSSVVQDDCRTRIAVQIDEVHPQGDDVRANGRVQIQRFRCNTEGAFESRRRILSNITAVDVTLTGGIKENCLEGELATLALDPSGLIGGVLNITGLTRRIEGRVRGKLNEMLNEGDNCIDLPDALQALNTRVTSGGFRDFGNGTMGFVVKGRLDVTAQNAITLLNLLYQDGRLDRDQRDCRVANPCPPE